MFKNLRIFKILLGTAYPTTYPGYGGQSQAPPINPPVQTPAAQNNVTPSTVGSYVAPAPSSQTVPAAVPTAPQTTGQIMKLEIIGI